MNVRQCPNWYVKDFGSKLGLVDTVSLAAEGGVDGVLSLWSLGSKCLARLLAQQWYSPHTLPVIKIIRW